MSKFHELKLAKNFFLLLLIQFFISEFTENWGCKLENVQELFMLFFPRLENWNFHSTIVKFQVECFAPRCSQQVNGMSTRYGVQKCNGADFIMFRSLSFVSFRCVAFLWAPSRHDRHLLNIFCWFFYEIPRIPLFFLFNETNNAVRSRSSQSSLVGWNSISKMDNGSAISIIEIAHCRLILLISFESFRHSPAHSHYVQLDGAGNDLIDLIMTSNGGNRQNEKKTLKNFHISNLQKISFYCPEVVVVVESVRGNENEIGREFVKED